ncbi:MAG: hypothetical protein IJV37_05440 [Bacteroidales bacterium]|nr:hypothetical protein [Bacteroidales bacterium]
MTKVTLNSGSFQYEEGAVKSNGDLSVDGKTINNINGQVEGLGSFDAYRSGEDLQYNLHPTSIDKGAQLAEAVAAVVAAVVAKL